MKDEIKEYSKPNQSPENKIDNTLIIKKLNRDKLDLEMNCNELKQQITELDQKHTELNGKVCKLWLIINYLSELSWLWLWSKDMGSINPKMFS